MTDNHFDVQSLMPDNVLPLMEGLWLGCMEWAIGDADTVAAFREATGNRWEPGKTALEQMIDNASGADRALITAFIQWANVNVWGTDDPTEGWDV